MEQIRSNFLTMRSIRKWFVKKRKQKKGELEYTPWIRLTDAHNKGREYEYQLEGCMVIGRVPEFCDVAMIDEPTVSGRQCRLYTEEGQVYLTDLDGTNPTYHNNIKVTEDVVVKNGDVISFGEVDLYIEIN